MTTLEKGLAVFLGLTLASPILFWYCLRPVRETATQVSPPNQADLPCHSANCTNASTDTVIQINLKADPCEDFYQFACGSNQQAVEERHQVTAAKEVEDMIASIGSLSEPPIFLEEKAFYQRCKNSPGLDSRLDDTVLDIFNQLGGWPLLQGAYWMDSYTWENFTARSRAVGMKTDWFLEFRVVEDIMGAGKVILQIDPPSYLKQLKGSLLEHRKELLKTVAILLGAPETVSNESSEVIDFEQKLVKLAQIRTISEDGPQRMTIRQVQLTWPDIPLPALIKLATKKEISGDQYVLFNAKDYADELGVLLKATPKRIQVDFIMWTMIEELWPYLPTPFRDLFEKYGEDSNLDRHSFCIKEAKKLYPLVAEAIYIRDQVTEERRKGVREMVMFLRIHFLKLLRGTDAKLTNRDERLPLLKKLGRTTFAIGGPEEVLRQFVERARQESRNETPQNIIETITQTRKRNYDKLSALFSQRNARESLDYYRDVLSVSDYTFLSNTIFIPVEVFKNGLYSTDVPNYINYARLGTSVARQMVHHVFNESPIYQDRSRFEEIERCYVGNSTSSLETDIQDPVLQAGSWTKFHRNFFESLALDVAYESYLEWTARYEPEPMVPGNNLPIRQLFWIEASKETCKQQQEFKQAHTAHNKSRTFESITAGPVMHSKNFAKEFGCREGSKMTRLHNCGVL